MTKKQKITLLSVFIALVVVVGVIAGVLNYRATQAGMKKFQLEIISERDNYSEITDCKSEAEYLGEFLRTLDGCEWTDGDYGIYITSIDGMQEDFDNQYWWSVNVNGESSTTGADEIPLQDGDTYSLVLKQGW